MRDHGLAQALRAQERAAADRLAAVVGGPARGHVVLVLGAVLALSSADQATVGSAGSEIERALGIDNTQLGILAAVTPLMGALGSIPAGMLVDRVRRTHLLPLAVALWSAAMLVSAASASYVMLVLTRVALGAVAATAGPSVASLTGDFFPSRERGRIYGFVLSGELLGAALGFLVTGEVAGAVSWRAAFAVLALPGMALAWWIWRSLPEPARGGQSQLPVGATEIVGAEETEDGAGGRAGAPERTDAVTDNGPPERTDTLAEEEVRRQRVRPRAELVLTENPARMSTGRAVLYTLRVRSNLILIVASALGYWFFQGLETFAVIFLERNYGISHALATLLLAVIVIVAIAGAVAGGRIADRLIGRGHLAARVLVGGVAYIVAAAALTPAFALSALGEAMIFYVIGALAVAAPNPPLDAARLDIMPSGLWGRAEGVRTVLRNLAQGIAPFMFGYLSDHLARQGSAGSASGFGAAASAAGLQETFLFMLIPLLISGLLMLRASRFYPRDVATAIASERAGRSEPAPPPAAGARGGSRGGVQ